MNQLPLPSVEMRQICLMCRRPSAMLGQYSPLWPYLVCRQCSETHPYPLEVLAPHTRRGKGDPTGLMINPAASSAIREWRIVVEGKLKDVARGCKLAFADGFDLTSPACWRTHREPGCRLCDRRSHKPRDYAAWGRQAVINNSVDQLEIPICGRCGQVHDHRYEILGTNAAHCARCEAEIEIETLWRMRSILGGEDSEAQLDKVFKFRPHLFAPGLLPDMWFALALKG